MSDFILNIARRSAGLSSGVLVEPAADPVFVPGLIDQDMRPQTPFPEQHPKVEVQGREANLLRHEEAKETKQAAGKSSAEPASRLIADESPTETEATLSMLTGDTELNESKRQVSDDPLSGLPGGIGRTSFPQRFARRSPDLQASNFQPTVEPQSSADLGERREKPYFVESSNEGPSQTPSSLQTRLTLRSRPIRDGQEDAVRVEQPAEPLLLESSHSRSDLTTRASENAPRTPIEPVAQFLRSNEFSSAQKPDAPGVTSLPQPIQVRIGTIEVRAEPAPGSRVPASPVPPSGFDDYNFIR